ncbi:MAG: 4-hydroxythreonine-4-phosphate dehydrogenase PdxA [Clostridia bacterium]|jgi:4-hydroxythreonine-4-phosphate dehydrogenase
MRIAITMGDACGVGPELILRAYKDQLIEKDFFVIGDYEVLDYCGSILRYELPLRRISDVDDLVDGYVNILDLGLLRRDQITIGRSSMEAGEAAVRYVEYATRLALEGKIDAIVTLPINKEASRLNDEEFTGHTELIAKLCNETNYTMMLASDKLIVTHVSTHVSMKEAIGRVKKDRIYNVIRLTHEALNRFRDFPKIAVAGLNPHAGENGSFGREDLEEIKPAVEKAAKEGIRVEGPLPPDTVFLKAYMGEYDAVVCMYHDQGHIPMKLLDFEGGVNVTLGLKIIRTSVDHGTAYDIAYKGIASTRSLVEAFRFAKKLIRQRANE